MHSSGLEGKTKDPSGALEAYRKGFPDLDKAIQLDPAYAPARRHRGNTILGTYHALRPLGKPTNDIIDNAIDDFKAAVQLDPSRTNHNALGEGYLTKGSYNGAIASFTKAIAVDASYAAPYSGLCVAYRMLGDWDAAHKYAALAAARDSGLRSKPCFTKKV